MSHMCGSTCLSARYQQAFVGVVVHQQTISSTAQFQPSRSVSLVMHPVTIMYPVTIKESILVTYRKTSYALGSVLFLHAACCHQ